MEDIKLSGKNVELKTSYRYFLSDIAPGGFLILYVLIFYGSSLMKYFGNDKLAISCFIIAIFISIPIGFAINATSFLFIDRLILWISFKLFSNKLFLKLANKHYGNIEIFNQCKIQKKSPYAIIREAKLIGKMIDLYDKEGRIRETLYRLTGLEIFCRSLSFLFLIFLIIHIKINKLDNPFFIGIHFGLITTLLITASYLSLHKTAKTLFWAQVLYFSLNNYELKINNAMEIEDLFRKLKNSVKDYFQNSANNKDEKTE